MMMLILMGSRPIVLGHASVEDHVVGVGKFASRVAKGQIRRPIYLSDIYLSDRRHDGFKAEDT